LAEAFIISEQEGLVSAERAAERATEHIALKCRNVAMVKEVTGIQAIAHEFAEAAVGNVGTPSGHNGALRTGSFPVISAIGVLDYGELTDGVHTEELTTDSTRRVVDL